MKLEEYKLLLNRFNRRSSSDLFQIYCDLAKDLTGYEQAKFSLFDGEAQCSMGAAGVDDS